MNDLIKARHDYERVDAVIGRAYPVEPDSSCNRSRDRLLRARTGLLHIVNNVIPGISNSADREEMYLWVNGILTITQLEECDASTEGKA